jgi:hypothetical protein
MGALLCCCSPVAAAELTTLDGKKLSGVLLAVDRERVTIRVGDAPVLVPSKNVMVIELGNAAAALPSDQRYHEIELVDGSILRVSNFSIKARRLECTPLVGPPGVPPPRYELTLDVVYSVMRNAGDAAWRATWKKMLTNRSKRDLYVIREGDTLNFLQGTIHGGNAEGTRLDFERSDGQRTSLLLSRATGGLVFAHTPMGAVPPTLCKVIDRFGNTLVAQTVQFVPEDNSIQITTVAGVQVRYSSQVALVRFDFSTGNIAYLSDLPMQLTAPELPAEEKALRLHLQVPLLKDRALSGDPLKVAGHPPFAKGLLVAPDTVITWDLAGEYREFHTVAGLPESVLDGQLAIRLVVEGDGRILFQDTLRRKDPPRSLTLDVKGVQQLRIIVEGDFAVNGNRLVLGEARVLK